MVVKVTKILDNINKILGREKIKQQISKEVFWNLANAQIYTRNHFSIWKYIFGIEHLFRWDLRFASHLSNQNGPMVVKVTKSIDDIGHFSPHNIKPNAVSIHLCFRAFRFVQLLSSFSAPHSSQALYGIVFRDMRFNFSRLRTTTDC